MQVLTATLRLPNGPRPSLMLYVMPRTAVNVAVKDSQLSRALRWPESSSSWYAVRTAAAGVWAAVFIRSSASWVTALCTALLGPGLCVG